MNESILNHYKSADPIIYKVMKDLDYSLWVGENKTSPAEFFNSLCTEIISQQLSGKAATAIRTKFLNLFPDQKFSPEDILKMPDQTIRGAGLSWAKIKYMKDLSSKVKNNEVKLSNLHNMSDQEVIDELTKVKGIGNWTAEMFLMFTLRRHNVFSFGDLGLKKGLIKLYGLNEPTPEEITKIVTRWDPYKTYGSIALWRSLEL